MTSKPKESLGSTIVSLLREVQVRDPEAFANLVSWRASVNADMQQHSPCPLSSTRGKAQLSLLGVLNGMLRAYSPEEQKIAAVVDNDIVVGFTLLPTPAQAQAASSGTTGA